MSPEYGKVAKMFVILGYDHLGQVKRWFLLY
jgi:hypothetical protein